MNQILLTPEEAALRALGVACQTASRYYETASDVTEDEWQAFTKRRSEAYKAAAERVAALLRREEVLPGSPDADMEWLKQLALRAQAAISGDEAGTLLKSFARTEARVWETLGELGVAGISADGAQMAKEISALVLDGFLWLGKEKEAFLGAKDD